MKRMSGENDEPSTEAVLVSDVIPATRERVFGAWLDSGQHSAFTGSDAEIVPEVGGRHSVLEGYAVGIILALDPARRIVQSWRATDFPRTSADSIVEVTLEETVGGTLLTILHSEIPTGQSDRYREAWLRRYLEPLKRYFTGRVSNGVHAADTRALGKADTPADAKKPAASGKKSAPTSAAKRATKTTTGPTLTMNKPNRAARTGRAATRSTGRKIEGARTRKTETRKGATATKAKAKVVARPTRPSAAARAAASKSATSKSASGSRGSKITFNGHVSTATATARARAGRTIFGGSHQADRKAGGKPGSAADRTVKVKPTAVPRGKAKLGEAPARVPAKTPRRRGVKKRP